MKNNKCYTVENKMIKSTGRDIRILIIRPLKNAKPKEKTPGVLWIHGGGYVTDELNINSSQIMVGGESAGGGLTVALCMYARDKGDVNIAYQMYSNCFHAFDMMLPFKKISQEAIEKFEKEFLYATEHYFAKQN